MEVAVPKEVADLIEPVVDGDEHFLARGGEGVEQVDDHRPIDERDQGLRPRQGEGAEPAAEAPGDDHGLHPPSEEGPRISIFCPGASLPDDRYYVVSSEDGRAPASDA